MDEFSNAQENTTEDKREETKQNSVNTMTVVSSGRI